MAPSIPSKHEAIIYDNPGTISTKIEEIETPKPGIGEVLVHLTHSGVYLSDMGVRTNSWTWLPAQTQKGQVGGHEGVREIASLGEGTEGMNLEVGKRVGIKWLALNPNRGRKILTERDNNMVYLYPRKTQGYCETCRRTFCTGDSCFETYHKGNGLPFAL